MIIDLAETTFGLAITHDFDDQSYALSTNYPRLLKNRLHVGCKQVASSLTSRHAWLEIVLTLRSCQTWCCRRVKIKSEGKYVESTFKMSECVLL
jgi:hypothetical protein